MVKTSLHKLWLLSENARIHMVKVLTFLLRIIFRLDSHGPTAHLLLLIYVLCYSLHASIHLDGGAGDAHSDNFTDICCDTVKKKPYIKKRYKKAQQFPQKLPAVSSLYY